MNRNGHSTMLSPISSGSGRPSSTGRVTILGSGPASSWVKSASFGGSGPAGRSPFRAGSGAPYRKS